MLKALLIVFISCFFLIGCGVITSQKYNSEAAKINAKLGIAYLQQNKIESAKKKLLLARAQAPYEAKVHDALGYFFAHTGEQVIAEEHYLYAIKCAHKKSVIWHHYGLFLYQQNRYQEALKYFLLAARDANYLFIAKAYVDASNAALQLKQSVQAQQYRKAAFSHDPHVFDTMHKKRF